MPRSSCDIVCKIGSDGFAHSIDPIDEDFIASADHKYFKEFNGSVDLVNFSSAHFLGYLGAFLWLPL